MLQNNMTSPNSSRLFSAYATEYGTFLGVAWIADFALYISGIRQMSTPLLLLAMLLFIGLPVVAFCLANRFRSQVPDGWHIGFWRAYIFSLMMMMYACFLTAAGEYVYFRYMDHGLVFRQINAVLTDPAATQAYSAMGLSDSLALMRQTIDTLADTSPLNLALALFNQNVFISLILAIPTAFFAKKQ